MVPGSSVHSLCPGCMCWLLLLLLFLLSHSSQSLLPNLQLISWTLNAFECSRPSHSGVQPFKSGHKIYYGTKKEAKAKFYSAKLEFTNRIHLSGSINSNCSCMHRLLSICWEFRWKFSGFRSLAVPCDICSLNILENVYELKFGVFHENSLNWSIFSAVWFQQLL